MTAREGLELASLSSNFVIKVGASEARRPAREALEVDVRGDRLAARVELEDQPATRMVGLVDGDVPVDAADAWRMILVLRRE